MEATKRCPMCGEKILAVAKKCRFCGEYLETKEKTVSRKNKTVAAFALPVILGVITAACFSLSENGWQHCLPRLSFSLFSALR